KLSALGHLVAGVAHELNTPIGNAMTAATTLSDTAQDFARRVHKGEVKRSQFDVFIERIVDGSELTARSLRRAAELLASFKQVAVDQASERRRSFDLAEVVGEVVDTLRPTLQQQPWAVVVDIPPDLRMDSHPGPLGQILINLVMNATIHAFRD